MIEKKISQNEIRLLLKELGLDEFFYLGKKNYERSYYIILTKNLFLKILLFYGKTYQSEFKNEVNVQKNISDSLKNQPKIIKFNLSKPPYFILRNLVAGSTSGSPLQYSNSFYQQSPANIIKKVKALQSVDSKKIFTHRPIKRAGSWHLSGWKQDRFFSAYYNEVYKKYFSQNELKILDNIIKRNSELLNNKFVLSHGDLHGGNILNFRGKLSLIDWSQLHLNNYLFDFGYLYVNAWNNQVWQKKLYRYIIKTKSDEKIFICDLIRWYIRQLGLANHGLEIYPKKSRLKIITQKHYLALQTIIKKYENSH